MGITVVLDHSCVIRGTLYNEVTQTLQQLACTCNQIQVQVQMNYLIRIETIVDFPWLEQNRQYREPGQRRSDQPNCKWQKTHLCFSLRWLTIIQGWFPVQPFSQARTKKLQPDKLLEIVHIITWARTETLHIITHWVENPQVFTMLCLDLKKFFWMAQMATSQVFCQESSCPPWMESRL